MALGLRWLEQRSDPILTTFLIFITPSIIALIFALPRLPVGTYFINGIAASLGMALWFGVAKLSEPEYAGHHLGFIIGFVTTSIPALVGVGLVGAGIIVLRKREYGRLPNGR